MIKKRPTSGASLFLSAALLVLIAIVGLAVFYMVLLFGGSRELQNATDSGNLNVAKTALTKPSISLQAGVESNNFAAFADQQGNVDLLTYNRLVGQTLLVALNAQAESSTPAQQNVQTLVGALQSGDNNLSFRLGQQLSGATTGTFSDLAQSNSLRMLPNSTVRDAGANNPVAYLDPTSPMNLYVDGKLYPSDQNGSIVKLPAQAISSTNSSSGLPYIQGYADIVIGSGNTAMPAIAGAAVHPQQQPHMVSSRDFQSALALPLTAGSVPPNTFKTQSQTTGLRQLSTEACSTVGALSKDYPASIPHGYLVITNPSGYTFTGQLPNANSVFNNQLYTGLYISNNGAFSTDEDSLESWANYNNGGRTGQQPSTAGIYGADPNAITSLGGGGNNYPVEADYTMCSGDGALPQVVSLLPAIENAYDASNSLPGSPVELIAVEDMKGEVMNMFANQQTGTVPAPSGYSGLRLFNHTQQYPVASGASPLISESGNTIQLLNDVGNGANTTVLNAIKQRIYQIKPSATDNEITQLLQSNLIGLGETWYVYMDPNSGNLTMSQSMPPWTVPSTSADGTPWVMASAPFETIGLSVDPPGEAGFNNALYDVTSNPATTGLATDEAIFTPSSGFNNLLGTLEFRESVLSVTASTTTNSCNCGCTFPWDAAVANLGPNATAQQVANLIGSYNYMAYTPTYSVSVGGHTYTFNGTNYFGPGPSAFTWACTSTGMGGDPMGYYPMYAAAVSSGSNSFTDGNGNTCSTQPYQAALNAPGSGPQFASWYDSQVLCSHNGAILYVFN